MVYCTEKRLFYGAISPKVWPFHPRAPGSKTNTAIRILRSPSYPRIPAPIIQSKGASLSFLSFVTDRRRGTAINGTHRRVPAHTLLPAFVLFFFRLVRRIAISAIVLYACSFPLLPHPHDPYPTASTPRKTRQPGFVRPRATPNTKRLPPLITKHFPVSLCWGKNLALYTLRRPSDPITDLRNPLRPADCSSVCRCDVKAFAGGVPPSPPLHFLPFFSPIPFFSWRE